jgi:hypothetical protein
MPVTWSVDTDKKLVTIVAEGIVTRDDLDAFMDGILAADVISFRKLFDGTFADPRMEPEDYLAIGGRIRRHHDTSAEIGPLAVVLSEDKMVLLERVAGMLAVADRPMKIFTSSAEARRWINRKELTRPKRTRIWRETGKPGPGRPKKPKPAGGL